MEKSLNTKVLELTKIYILYIVHFTIWESYSKQLSQSLESHIDSVKLFVRIVDFEIHFPKTLSNAKMVYISNVDPDDWSNIGIHNFSSWDDLGFQKQASRCENSKFNIWEFETLSNEKLTMTPIVGLEELYKLCIHDFCIWDHLWFGQGVFS
jgi:hypothetical protein